MFDYEIDNLTLTLLLAIVATLLYSRIAKPSPLAHPLLLGKQAEVSAVRKEGESGVYRSFATGHGTPVSYDICSLTRPRCVADCQVCHTPSQYAENARGYRAGG